MVLFNQSSQNLDTKMANCPFCSSVLLRHVRAGEMYWFCRRCRTEVLQTKFSQSNNSSTPLEDLVGSYQPNSINANEPSPERLIIHKD